MEEIHVNISISQWQIIHDAIFFKSLSSFYSLELENFLQFEIIDLCMNSLLKFIPLSLVVFFFQKELSKMSDLIRSIDELDFNQSLGDRQVRRVYS